MEEIEVGELKEIDAKEVRYLYHKSGNPLEEALMIQKLMGDRPQHKVAKILEISQGQISKRLRLLTLHPILQERLRNGDLHASTAYALSKLAPELQKEYVDQEKVTLKEVETKCREQAISKEVMSLLDKSIDLPRNPPADYQRSYWKAVELQEKVENGTIKIHKNYVERVLGILREIQKAAFEG